MPPDKLFHKALQQNGPFPSLSSYCPASEAVGVLTTKGSERTEARGSVALGECGIAPNVLSIRG
jgi:hypothetical protein